MIAFHAYLSIDSSGTLTRYYVLKFDIVPLNNGYGYNSFDDIFTVSFSGTYVFTWSCKSDVDGYVFTELTKNTDVIRNRFAGSLNSPVYNFSTGIVVAYVNKDANVYVRMIKASRSKVRRVVESRTTFSGWLLR